MTIYMTIIMIEGSVESAGAYVNKAQAEAAVKETVSRWLEEDGFDAEEIAQVIGNGASPDGAYQYWVQATSLE
jgi:hypothetical protein